MKLPAFKLEEWFAIHEFSAPHLLCCSDCETVTVRELLHLTDSPEEALQNLLDLRLGYTDCRGAASLREAIASSFYKTMSAEDIVVHAGAEEAIFTFSMQFGPGDHVVVLTPNYQSLSDVAKSRGVEVSPWQLREAPAQSLALEPAASNGGSRWVADFGELTGLIRENTRALIVNSPHNPTGFVFSPPELEAVVSLCRSRGLYLFSDEVYAGLEHPSGRQSVPLPKACDLYDKAVSLSVVSKAQGLAGLRIGWVASKDRVLLDAMTAVKHYTSICSSGPSELLAEVAVRRSAALCRRNLDIIEANLHHVEEFLRDFSHVLSWCRPAAGCIGLIRLDESLGMTAQELAEAAVREAGVLLLPSEFFDFGHRHLRLGFGRSDFPKCLQHLRTFLAARAPPRTQ